MEAVAETVTEAALEAVIKDMNVTVFAVNLMAKLLVYIR